MKVVLTIKVFNEEEKRKYMFEKEYASMIVPRIGEKIKDSLFDINREVIDVIYDFSADLCSVIIIDKVVSDNKLIKHFQDITKLHNWIQKVFEGE
ncbi:MAG: hypothetical protein KAU02_05650 [Tenericutes bacterium]|nr:hypothetical protein [Mycoplasmatota bacterium]